MRNRSGLLANLLCALALTAGGATAAPAVAPLAPQTPKAAPAGQAAGKPAAKSERAPKRAAVHNTDALDLGSMAEVVDNYELGASVGGSDVPGASEMDQEIDGLVNKITKPPASKKGMAPAPAKVPEAALPRKSHTPALAPKKTEPAPAAAAPTPSPMRVAPPAVPSGETGAITDHAMIETTSSLSPSLSRIELAALAAMMFPRPKWRNMPEPADAGAYFALPRGI
ncbi:MAG: hypothetical protein U1E87_09430 [Alphaproteobacteria bacterium]